MTCSKCGITIGDHEHPAYQVRMGEADGAEFVPDQDVGYYCGNCIGGGI